MIFDCGRGNKNQYIPLFVWMSSNTKGYWFLLYMWYTSLTALDSCSGNSMELESVGRGRGGGRRGGREKGKGGEEKGGGGVGEGEGEVEEGEGEGRSKVGDIGEGEGEV